MVEPVPGDRGRSTARAPVPWRTILATIAAAAGAYVTWLLIIATQREITWIVVAAFFAVVLSPPVDFLVRRAHLRRTLAAFIVFVIGFAGVGGLLYLFIRPIINEVNKLVHDFPRLVQDAQAGRGPIGHLVKKYDLVNKAKQYEPKLQKYVSSSGSQALTILRKIGNGVVSALTILVLTFLLLVEGTKILGGVTSMVSPPRQERLKRLGRNSSRAISGYMIGNILISLIASGVTYLGLWVFGVPFRGVAAVWVGFADLIPLVGATLGAIPTVGLSFLHSVTAGVGMIVVYVVYQQFENHVIQVAIMSRTVKLSPLGVLVSLLIGVQLFGLIGALLAIPAAGIIHVVAVDAYQERQASRSAARPNRSPPDDGSPDASPDAPEAGAATGPASGLTGEDPPPPGQDPASVSGGPVIDPGGGGSRNVPVDVPASVPVSTVPPDGGGATSGAGADAEAATTADGP
jgi:predicted PurR-regulated permease PerM